MTGARSGIVETTEGATSEALELENRTGTLRRLVIEKLIVINVLSTVHDLILIHLQMLKASWLHIQNFSRSKTYQIYRQQ